jgi:hypothetical protein
MNYFPGSRALTPLRTLCPSRSAYFAFISRMLGLGQVRDLGLPQSMQRAMARQAEAEREKRAKVIHAEGEFTASQQLADAAEVIGSQPATLQLRYLQTLTEIAAEKNGTIVFPLPFDLVEAFLRLKLKSNLLPLPAGTDVDGNVPPVARPS